MTPNKQTVTTYMEGFRGTDRAAILFCLTDDVEWEIPGGFHARREAGVREVFCDVVRGAGHEDSPSDKLPADSVNARWQQASVRRRRQGRGVHP